MVAPVSSEIGAAVSFVNRTISFYTEISTEIIWDGSTEFPDNISLFGNESIAHNFTELDLNLPTVICSSIVLILINLTVVIGNILVLLAVYCERSLRTATNYFIFNLALADLLLGTLVLPFSGAYEVLQVWPFGNVFCDVWAAVDVLCCTASINSLCCISIDRYIGVTRPLQHRIIMRHRRAVFICIFVWVFSFLIAVGPLFGWRPPKIKPLDCPLSDSIDYVMFSVAGSFYIPLVIILVLYARIYCEVVARDPGPMGSIRQASIRSRGQNGNAGIQLRVHVGSQRSHPSGSRSSHRREMRYRTTPASQRVLTFNREKKVAKTLGIVVGVFILCWFPFFFLLPLASACPACVPETVFKIVFWLGYCNSFVNPLIYALSNHTFRRAFRKIVTCRYWLRRKRRRFHAKRWSNISRYTASSTLSSPIVSNSRYSKRGRSPPVFTPEASPMLTDVSPSPSPSHITPASGLTDRQQNGNLTEYKPDRGKQIRNCDELSDTQYGNNTNGIRRSTEIATIEECESMLSRTHSSSTSSIPSIASASSSSSDEELMNADVNGNALSKLNRTNQSSDIHLDSCRSSRQNLSRRASISSRVSATRHSSCASNCSRHISNGAIIPDLTPPDLVADIYDKIQNGSDIKYGEKEIKDDVFGLLSNENSTDSKETSV